MSACAGSSLEHHKLYWFQSATLFQSMRYLAHCSPKGACDIVKLLRLEAESDTSSFPVLIKVPVGTQKKSRKATMSSCASNADHADRSHSEATRQLGQQVDHPSHKSRVKWCRSLKHRYSWGHTMGMLTRTRRLGRGQCRVVWRIGLGGAVRPPPALPAAPYRRSTCSPQSAGPAEPAA